MPLPIAVMHSCRSTGLYAASPENMLTLGIDVWGPKTQVCFINMTGHQCVLTNGRSQAGLKLPVGHNGFLYSATLTYG